jgi:hypothetical protein
VTEILPEARRSHERYLAFLRGELSAAEYYTDGVGPPPQVRAAFRAVVARHPSTRPKRLRLVGEGY